MSRCRQSTASRAGAAASSASTRVPTRPPVSTSEAYPRAAQASTSLVTSRAATALASSSPSRWMRTWGGAAMTLPLRADGEAGQRLPVYRIGIEPAQFLGNQLGRIPAVQRDPSVLLAGAAEDGGPPVRPGDRDVPVGHGEPHLGDARPFRHVTAQPRLQPLGQPRPDPVRTPIPRLRGHPP